MDENLGVLNCATDEEIRDAFRQATTVVFFARNHNSTFYRYLTFNKGKDIFTLEKIFTILGITPQMLRPVFNSQLNRVKRCFPFNLTWFGLNKNCHKSVTVELPQTIETYEQLGSFPFQRERFIKLAEILNKPIEVNYGDGGLTQDLLFTAYPDGRIIEHKKVIDFLKPPLKG